jgi:hypothetical protein
MLDLSVAPLSANAVRVPFKEPSASCSTEGNQQNDESRPDHILTVRSTANYWQDFSIRSAYS